MTDTIQAIIDAIKKQEHHNAENLCWLALKKQPNSSTTCFDCIDNSRVGEIIIACGVFFKASTICKVLMAKHAVFPVPDCACAMTSFP